ncbi:MULTISPECIES: hypothetical protein [Roseobacteraceae]|uniref:Uncharacterized protein n=1 Tax=Pseudosulfitobacter pseudonitzschiae TaxID=1402135 RepID=A0A221K768_9RHOB|nr:MULTISPECIES: hypothetical protein [Roseobacteraceae]ASM74841.1 hypothetical protein SULPSESMR1_03914 [Pseudosulfitobacter pseudonitzschiae]
MIGVQTWREAVLSVPESDELMACEVPKSREDEFYTAAYLCRSVARQRCAVRFYKAWIR